MSLPPSWAICLSLSIVSLHLVNPASKQSEHDSWSPALIDQLRPYKLTEKRVHEQHGISWKQKRQGPRKGENGKANKEEALSSDWRQPDPEEEKLLEQIPTIGPHADFSFMANQSLLHLRTATYQLRHDQCLEVHFRVEGKRTRLLLYTCRMYEGGLCVLDKFLATTNQKKLDATEENQLDVCHKLQPWMYSPSPFAFHFRFVRRPRTFSDREAEMRHFRRRFGRHATREVGRVQLGGFHPCNSACKGLEDSELAEDQVPKFALQDRHQEDPFEGWGPRQGR